MTRLSQALRWRRKRGNTDHICALRRADHVVGLRRPVDGWIAAFRRGAVARVARSFSSRNVEEILQACLRKLVAEQSRGNSLVWRWEVAFDACKAFTLKVILVGAERSSHCRCRDVHQRQGHWLQTWSSPSGPREFLPVAFIDVAGILWLELAAVLRISASVLKGGREGLKSKVERSWPACLRANRRD